jgi:hypothetical protein
LNRGVPSAYQYLHQRYTLDTLYCASNIIKRNPALLFSYLFNMPKKPSVKKGAAAQFQNWKAVKAAVDGKGALNFLSVMKAMGNSYFQLCSADGKLFQATPRGLFGRGAMRIDVGQIAVAEGSLTGKNILEIVGVIRERQEAEEYVEQGKLPAKVLALAISAGTQFSAEDEKKKALEAVDEAVTFEGEEAGDSEEEADGEPAKGGMKQSRAKAATIRAISSRAALLIKGGGGSMRVELGEEMDARALAEGDLYWQPPKVRKLKPKALLPAYVEPVEAKPAEVAEDMGFSLYSAAASEEVELSHRVAEREALLTKASALRAQLAAAPLRENWDDEEVDINDL